LLKQVDLADIYVHLKNTTHANVMLMMLTLAAVASRDNLAPVHQSSVDATNNL
jgi:hypothetical protein